MPLLTPADIRQHLSTGMEDAALLRLIAAEEAALVKRWGDPIGAAVQLLFGSGSLLTLRRPANAISAVSETRGSAAPVTLAANDYDIWPSGRIVARLNTGTNRHSGWGDRVQVTYTPVDDTVERLRVLIALVALDAREGVRAESFDDWRIEYAIGVESEQSDYVGQRRKLIDSLHSRPLVVA